MTSPKKPKASSLKPKKNGKSLSKEEIRHNAAKLAWATRLKNGWVPKPRTPKGKTVPIIELEEPEEEKKKSKAKTKSNVKKQIKASKAAKKQTKQSKKKNK